MKKLSIINIICILAFLSCNLPASDPIEYADSWEITEPLVNSGRLAISSDGNQHDTDDWPATSMALSLLAKSGNQSKLVYYGYNDHIWDSAAGWEEQVETGLFQSAELWGGFDTTKFYDSKNDKDEAVAALTDEINLSTAENPLIIIGAGPMAVIGKAIENSSAEVRDYVMIISHSDWNSTYLAADHGSKYVAQYISSDLNVYIHKIQDQNSSLNATPPSSGYSWLRESTDPALRYIWDRNEAAMPLRSFANNTFDASDAGMMWFYLFNEENATPGDLQTYFTGD